MKRKKKRQTVDENNKARKTKNKQRVEKRSSTDRRRRTYGKGVLVSFFQSTAGEPQSSSQPKEQCLVHSASLCERRYTRQTRRLQLWRRKRRDPALLERWWSANEATCPPLGRGEEEAKKKS